MIYFLLGSCLGSFLCVVAQRVPLQQDFIFSRSKCDSCQKVLRPWEMIPLFSCLLLKFRCQRCGGKIPAAFWLAELIYGGLFYFCWLQPTLKEKLIALLWLTTVFLLSLTDWFYFIVEPKILYPLHALLWGMMLYFKQPFYWTTVGTVVLLAAVLLVTLKDSMGLGDWLLLGLWAPWLSPLEFSQLLFAASSCALVFFGLYFLIQKKRLQRLPFVPFLSLGLLLVYFI